jgi:GNAT superfamily N-acetyltransferase
MDKKIEELITYNFVDYKSYQSYEALLNEQVIGTCNYSVDKGKAWLYIVRVAEPFRKYGIGGNLIRLMENDCALRRVREIEGKYFPQGEEDSVVRKFYAKHGYSIYDEGYEHFVSKFSPEKQDISGLKITKSKGMEK